MKKLSFLLENLIFTHSTNNKIQLIYEYLKNSSLPDKGYAIALLTNNLTFKNIKRSKVIHLIKSKLDTYLFEQSYYYVGDLAETIALIWPNEYKQKRVFSLEDIIIKLNSDKDIDEFIIYFLDHAIKTEKWAFIKLLLGGIRVGVSSSIVKKAIAKYGEKKLEEIENIWNGLKPPYTELFLWLEKKADLPLIDQANYFHSFMLAHSMEKKLLEKIINNQDYYVEYKWDGIRVQLIIKNNNTKIFSRSGDNISNSFPEIQIKSNKLIVLDGELLVGKNLSPNSFNNLQKRINKKKPSKDLLVNYPAFIKLYDVLFLDGKDLRKKNLQERRSLLEEWFLKQTNDNLDISKLINYSNKESLIKSFKSISKKENIEGLMIKYKHSGYIAGRKKGHWYKWKKDPKFLDTILMYAQRGHGKRSSYYSDFTFGVWKNNTIVPIAKAYSGYTDTELEKIDKFIRKNTIAKYGPVREVKKELVFELAFDSMNESNRHKSGIALRFPRVHRIRWDKPTKDVLGLDEIKRNFL